VNRSSIPRILVTDSIHPICVELLETAGFEAQMATGKTHDELLALAPWAHAWIIRSGTTISSDLIDAASLLRVIGRAGVGVDNVDLDAATVRGILVINSPEGNTISTAEHTVAMLLALSRKIVAASSSLKGGEWKRNEFTGIELYEKTQGVIGVGKIGRAVAARMAGFEMRMIGCDPVLSSEVASSLGIELMSLDDLLAESDFITIHTPINDSTRGLLNDKTLSKCRDGVGIVNCARGGIVDENALLRALTQGKVGGAALDVYTEEPPPAGPETPIHRLINHPLVVATPHIAASTEEAQEKVARHVTEQVIRALNDEMVQTSVNALAIRMASQPEVRPYVNLGEKLGKFAQQMTDSHIGRIRVGCRGEIPKRHAEVIEVAVLKGILSGLSTRPVNLINAPILAEDIGLKSGVETHPVEDGFVNRIDVDIDSRDFPVSVSGSLFGDREPHIVRIQGFRMDVRPTGSILLYRNIDKPGMLARVGAILAEEGINIAALALGRQEPGTEALTAISVDESIPERVLDLISALEGVSSVRPIRL